ncbi:MAG TPA: hypothetical protein VM141_01095 [Planctomycetota bacterium]|nr:hypothetical protein [Planctomycetota bacterium]
MCDLADANTQRPLGNVVMGWDKGGRGAVIIALNDGKFRNVTTCTADTIADALTAAVGQLDEVLTPGCPHCERLRGAVGDAIEEMCRQRPDLLA